MADFMISYASVDYSYAQRVAGLLRANGRSVWLDAGTPNGTGVELAGIPGGQQHWATIRSAIDEASTFLILETPRWQASAYCAKEYEYARSNGKRIAVLSETMGSDLNDVFVCSSQVDIASFLRHLEAGNEIAATHARLVSELHSVTTSRSRTGREQVRDAEALSTAPLPELGLSLNSSLQQRIVVILRAGRTRRRHVQGTIAAVLVVLLAMTGVAFLASQQAVISSENAQERANYAISLQLAQQAIQSQTTAESLKLAKRSLELNDNDATRAALIAAETNAFRSTAVISTGPSRAAAVSNDGRTTLILQRKTLYTVDAKAGKVEELSIEVDLSSSLAISPDGAVGYGIDKNDVLNCIDVANRRITATPQNSVVSINVSPDGTLWWLNRAGLLFRSSACPSGPAPVVAAGINSVLGFLVAGSPANIFTLTNKGTVQVHPLPESGGFVGEPLTDINLSTVPSSGMFGVTDKPDYATTNSLILCGDTVHILAGFKAVMGSGTHVAFSVSGKLESQRTTNMEMVGVGCAPNERAWAAPTLSTKAVALPATGVNPVDEIDTRDAGSRVVIANSLDSSHTVVVHGDGRVNVLATDKGQWVEWAGENAVAVPLSEGIVTVDTNGTVGFKSDTTVKPLGKIGSAPALWTASTTKTAYVAAGDKVFAITADGIAPALTMPNTVYSLSLAQQGKSLVVNGYGYVIEVNADLSGELRQLTLPELPYGETVSSIDLDGSRQILATDYGRVLVTNKTGKLLVETSTGVAGIGIAKVLPDHNIVVVGGAGMINKYSPDLHLLKSHLFGPMAVNLQASQDGKTLLVSLSGDFSVWAVDAQTMQPIARISTKTPDSRLVSISADGQTVVQLIPAPEPKSSSAHIVKTLL